MGLPAVSLQTPMRYEVVQSVPRAESLVRQLHDYQGRVAVDTEVVGWSPSDKVSPVYNAQCVCWSLCFEQERAFTILNHDEHGKLLRVFAPWLESVDHHKMGHNFKFDMHVFANHGVRVRGVAFDSLIAGGLLDETRRLSLEELVKVELHESYPSFAQTFAFNELSKERKNVARRRLQTRKIKGLEEVLDPTSPRYQPGKLHYYAAKDAWLEFRLANHVWRQLDNTPWLPPRPERQMREKSLLEYFQKFELPFLRVLFEMERVGIWLDCDMCHNLDALWRDEADQTLGSLIRTFVERGVPQKLLTEFSPHKSAELAVILYDILKLPTGKRSEITGKYSVDHAEIERLSGAGFPEAKLLNQYTKLSKLYGTYTTPLPKLVDSSGRIHANFKQNFAVTGRMSCENPNLMAIPTRTEEGQMLRNAFAAAPGETMICADLSQIEYRVFAHFARDEKMIKGFKDGEDYHATTARVLFPECSNASAEDFKQNEDFKRRRSQSKTVNFGILYGMGPDKLGKALGIGKDAAIKLLQTYDRRFPTVPPYRARVEAQAQRFKYVRTYIQRYRHIHNIDHPNRQWAAAAKRQAMNSIMQGSAADYMKMVMILVHYDDELLRLGCYMQLQVHDELVCSVPTENAEAALKRLVCLMEDPFSPLQMQPLRVPIVAEAKCGANWALAK